MTDNSHQFSCVILPLSVIIMSALIIIAPNVKGVVMTINDNYWVTLLHHWILTAMATNDGVCPLPYHDYDTIKEVT